MAVVPQHQNEGLSCQNSYQISSVERTSDTPVVVFQGVSGEKIKLPSTPVTHLDETTKERIHAALEAAM